jgi:hypothetical protein
MNRPDDLHLSREEGEVLIKRLETQTVTAEDFQVLTQVVQLYFWLLFALKEIKLSLHRMTWINGAVRPAASVLRQRCLNEVGDKKYQPSARSAMAPSRYFLSIPFDRSIVRSQKRRTSGPNRVKIIVTNLLDVSANAMISQYAVRRQVELVINKMKDGLHFGQMQVSQDAK